MAKSGNFAALNDLENLQARMAGKDKKRRKVGDARDDEVGDKLAKAQTPEEVANVAAGYGVPDDRIRELAKKAPNFGQFRMTVGNLCRGSIARRSRYEKDTNGKTLTWAEAGDEKTYRAKMSEFRKSQRPAKAPKEPKPAKTKAGKPAKGGKSKGGVKTIEEDGSIRNPDGSLAKGAPSKQEAAGRGKGRKGKAKQAVAAAARTSAPEGVQEGGDGTASQEQPVGGQTVEAGV